jgi:hypothetical protein
MLALGVVATATVAFGAAQLVPEHQHRIGTCPAGGQCAWDCGGSQCEFGFGQQICENDVDCPISYLAVPSVTAGRGRRARCRSSAPPSRAGSSCAWTKRRSLRAARHGCNQTTDDDCGSKVTVALRVRTPSATEVAVSKDINLCNTGALACSQVGDCGQCLDGGFNCPRPDPVFLCNGQGDTDITEADIDVFGQFTSWLNDMQPFDFLTGSLPAELQTGIPMVLAAAQTASGKFCSGTVPRTACNDDSECGGGSCYAEAEYCVTLGLVRGRCLGGTNEGTLCVADGECDSGNCGIAGVPDIGGLVTDDTDVSVADLGTCGGGGADVRRRPTRRARTRSRTVASSSTSRSPGRRSSPSRGARDRRSPAPISGIPSRPVGPPTTSVPTTRAACSRASGRSTAPVARVERSPAGRRSASRPATPATRGTVTRIRTRPRRASRACS